MSFYAESRMNCANAFMTKESNLRFFSIKFIKSKMFLYSFIIIRYYFTTSVLSRIKNWRRKNSHMKVKYWFISLFTKHSSLVWTPRNIKSEIYTISKSVEIVEMMSYWWLNFFNNRGHVTVVLIIKIYVLEFCIIV